jgi:hypothetical protein
MVCSVLSCCLWCLLLLLTLLRLQERLPQERLATRLEQVRCLARVVVLCLVPAAAVDVTEAAGEAAAGSAGYTP